MDNIFKDIKSFSDIIDLMIRGLEHEWVKVEMTTFGYASQDNTCFGCAATNLICELAQAPIPFEKIVTRYGRLNHVGSSITLDQFTDFEESIDLLRKGRIADCLVLLKSIQGVFSFKIPEFNDLPPSKDLPYLYTRTYKVFLPYYREYEIFLREHNF